MASGYSRAGAAICILLLAAGLPAAGQKDRGMTPGRAKNLKTTSDDGCGHIESSGAHAVTLKWDASATAGVMYNVYRGTASGGPYSKINSSPAACLGFTDGTLASATTYYYVATAVDANGTESVYSNEATAVVP